MSAGHARHHWGYVTQEQIKAPVARGRGTTDLAVTPVLLVRVPRGWSSARQRQVMGAVMIAGGEHPVKA
jgi:hypothetical protein